MGMALVAGALLSVAPSLAADVTMTADDSIGSSSFNTGLHWSNGLAPSAGNDYYVGDFILRTPSDGNSYVFGGDALIVDNTTGYPEGLLYKGTGTSGVITVANLILDGGMITHANGTGDLLQLDGAISVVSDSRIYAKQGPINILAPISGSATITNPGSDGDGRLLRLMSAASTFDGDIVNNGRLELSAGAVLNFVIGPVGVNNRVSGSGIAYFDGTFVLDLSGAGGAVDATWTLVDVATQSFGPNFSIAGFAEDVSGVWVRRNYWFSEATGVLSYGTPPESVTAFPMITLTGAADVPNGAWCWYQDERCIVDADAPGGPRLLIGSVSSAADGDAESGDIDLLWLDLIGETIGHFELSNRLQRDDHDSAALWLRPDGRYLAAYSKHTADLLTRWRVSTNPHDPTAWGAEQTYTHSYNTTYNNLFYLPADNGGAGRLYNFSRIINWDPTAMASYDYGSTWASVGGLITMGGGSDRPYAKYYGNGGKIHFITTEGHPRDYDNSIYHGYVRDGVSYGSDGTVVDNDVFVGTGPLPTAFTPVFLTGDTFGGDVMSHAWTIDVAIDGDEPVVIFIARANGSTSDHRFFYARYATGSGWAVHELAAAGGYLYAAEDDYTGLASIDPDDPDVVVLSTTVDPRDGSATGTYELYQGRTADGGATWSWTALTEGSNVANLRPLIPSYSDGFERLIVWMRGGYATYTSWTTAAVVMREVVPERINWGCVGGPDVTTVPAGLPAAQFATLDRDGDGDVDMHDLVEFQATAQILVQ